MTKERKSALEQGLNTLKYRLVELQELQGMAQSELGLLPITDEFEVLREYYTDAIDSLDNITTDLQDLIGNVETELMDAPSSAPIPDPVEVRSYTVQPDDVRLSLFDKVALGIAGAFAIHKANDYLERKRQERAQRRHDDLFWQEAARRKDLFSNDDDSDNW